MVETKVQQTVTTYKVVLGLFPVEAMDEDGQDVARDEDVDHQGVHPHPLHGDGQPPVAVQVDQRINSSEEEARRAGGGQGVAQGVQWLVHVHSWERSRGGQCRCSGTDSTGQRG